ncbi:MAG TPA: maleylpyruvate isomerase family mycothiol-dependent enzyme [Pseudonocardiaceae bacterium]|nr:maleylpyruvate isomerase family mycothiol-dependent enzyme [Pseudonocardiaceae bacterium]
MTCVAPSRYLDWLAGGYDYFAARLKRITDAELTLPSGLPGWTGKHVLSHVGYNARALGRLAHWAATGERTPMYPDPVTRGQEIQSGAGWPAARLRAFVEEEHRHLTAALGRITPEQWQAKVVTAQGRTVTADTIPWLRARELWIHACDLPSGGEFSDFPVDLVDALVDDALSRRRNVQAIDIAVLATDRGHAPEPSAMVLGPAADLARWLTGRRTPTKLHTTDDTPLPHLPPWL